ncbi:MULTISPECIES: hypothetical protein [Arsenicicoccus]|uniref:hypothetical protein n=1 Tax=Arsenicicoccus TaxID=267408 RepID=UPI00041E844A|nr:MULTISPECIES: hypothetical protein [Arsenicicoccus]
MNAAHGLVAELTGNAMRSCEDVSYFLQKWPGMMIYVGAHVPGCGSFNHADDVQFDEVRVIGTKPASGGSAASRSRVEYESQRVSPFLPTRQSCPTW